MTADRITLRGVRAFGRHGVYEHERNDGQEFVIDVELELSLEAALRSDDVAATVHYGELAEAVVAVVGGEPVDLIETLAGRIADTILTDRGIDAVTVTVHKPSAPITVPFGDVSVTIRRDHPHLVVLALGSNLGDRRALLAAAVADVAALPGVALVAESPVVESAALTEAGVDDSKPAYFNQVLIVRTNRAPQDLLAAVQAIESRHGRVRVERWGDRTLDVDLISFDRLRLAEPDLELPHPRAHERAFVLVPWALADPGAWLEGHGAVADLAAAFPGEVAVVAK